MNFESGFLGKNGNLSVLNDSEGFTGFQTRYSSKTGFFRILVGKHLGRKVVIKTLKKEFAKNPVAVTQLKKEFSILFPLVSPYVVHAFSIVKIEDDVPAFEMEWCEGMDVRDLLCRGELTPEDAVRIIDGVICGLRDIHLAGIVHRDIKPENVIYDPFRKIVKIIDFGCAFITGGLALQGPNGTIGYTPEEKMNPGTEVEPKDDLYALGVMAAEMAESISADSRRGGEVKRNLKRFSENLKAGEYEKAENAAEAFEKLFRKKRNHRWAIAGALIGIAIILSILWSLYLPQHDSSPKISSHEIKSDTTAGKKAIHVPGDSEDNKTADVTAVVPKESVISGSGGEGKPANNAPEENKGAGGSQLTGEWKNPYSGISSEYEAAYELACTAGKLMEMYHSKQASPRVKMDGFVVEFCDSLYRAEKMYSKYPSLIDTDEMRELAKDLAAKYKNELEREFRKRFGETGDPHRREAMLEGRFYSALRVYNYNPRAKGTPKKSN